LLFVSPVSRVSSLRCPPQPWGADCDCGLLEAAAELEADEPPEPDAALAIP
jgi:hypothetical protein